MDDADHRCHPAHLAPGRLLLAGTRSRSRVPLSFRPAQLYSSHTSCACATLLRECTDFQRTINGTVSAYRLSHQVPASAAECSGEPMLSLRILPASLEELRSECEGEEFICTGTGTTSMVFKPFAASILLFVCAFRAIAVEARSIRCRNSAEGSSSKRLKALAPRRGRQQQQRSKREVGRRCVTAFAGVLVVVLVAGVLAGTAILH